MDLENNDYYKNCFKLNDLFELIKKSNQVLQICS